MLDKIGIRQESEKRVGLIVIWIINVDVDVKAFLNSVLGDRLIISTSYLGGNL